MTSLLILLMIMIVSLAVLAWLLAFVARLAGSTRGRLGVGIRAVLLILAINIAFAVASILIDSRVSTLPSAIGFAVLMLIAQLWSIFVVLRRMFVLLAKRALAVFGTYIGVVCIQLMLALGVLRPFVLEAFMIPTGSMSPTLDPGDRFVASKILSPRRWDLVVYWNTSEVERDKYVKRLIALPGERLRFSEGQIFINDQRMTVPAVLAGKCRAKPTGSRGGGWRYSDDETIALGPDEYFLIGDDIDISADSRIYGPTPAKDIIGVVDLIYWPAKKLRVVR